MSELSIYDLTRWKPITPVQYVDEMGSIMSLTEEMAPDFKMATTREFIEHGGYSRIVHTAPVLKHPPRGEGGEIVQEDEPYLMVLWYGEADEKRPNVCFIRTDVDLALP